MPSSGQCVYFVLQSNQVSSMPDLEEALTDRRPVRGGAARYVAPAAAFWAVPGHRGEAPLSALARALESAAAALGIGGQLCDGVGTAPQGSWFNVHTAFGVALCTAAIAHFHPTRRRLPAGAVGIAPFARRLSRRVYILLYGLMAIKLLVNLGTALRGPGGRPALPPFASPESFQIYLAYGVLALVIIKVLAHSHEAQRHAPIRTTPAAAKLQSRRNESSVK